MESLYRDLMFLWLQKKVSFKDLGVYLVGDDYFAKHNVPNGASTLGAVLPTMRGVAFIRAANQTTLAHELLHSFGAAHSNQKTVEGIGKATSEVWTNGISLDPNISLGTLANNYFTAFIDLGLAVHNLDRVSHNRAINALLTNKIDPKVVLVTGVIGSGGQPTYFEAQRGESFLDQNEQGDLLFQGLNSAGQVVSSVSTKSNNEIEFIPLNGDVQTITTSSSFFYATLPDDGTITRVRVLRNSQVIFTLASEGVGLGVVVAGLNAGCFDLKHPLSRNAVDMIQSVPSHRNGPV